MRLALALCLLTGCFVEQPSGDDTYYGGDYGSGYNGGGGLGSGWGGGSGSYDYGCQSDTECGAGLVCARTYECLAPSQVHAVHTTWTVDGEPASDATCANAPNLSITFSDSYQTQWGYTPVPCRAGKHTVDKMPIRYTDVQLAREYEYSGGAYGTFDMMGNAKLDLPY